MVLGPCFQRSLLSISRGVKFYRSFTIIIIVLFSQQVPRAVQTSAWYAETFGEEYTALGRGHIFPFLF